MKRLPDPKIPQHTETLYPDSPFHIPPGTGLLEDDPAEFAAQQRFMPPRPTTLTHRIWRKLRNRR